MVYDIRIGMEVVRRVSSTSCGKKIVVKCSLKNNDPPENYSFNNHKMWAATSFAILLLVIQICLSFRPVHLQRVIHRRKANPNKSFTSLARPTQFLYATPASSEDTPIAFVSSLSADQELESALVEVTKSALSKLPAGTTSVSLAIVSVSSSYDSQSSMSLVVPTIVAQAQALGVVIENLVGSTAGGVIGGVGEVRA